MSDENSAGAALAQHDPNSALARENADLRNRLARLERNVVDGGFRGELPRYQLNEPCFLDDTHFERGTVIDFTDAPNLSMVPLNEPARRAMAEQIALQTDGAREVAELRGRRFFGLVTDRNNLIDTAMSDAKAQAAALVPPPQIKMPTPIGQVPAMPHLPEAQAAARRGRGGQRKATAVPAEPQMGPEGNRPLAAPIPGTEGSYRLRSSAAAFAA